MVTENVRVASMAVFFETWAEIAIWQEAEARRWRAARDPTGSSSEWLSQEFRASLVCITSCSFAVEAWVLALAEKVKIPADLVATWDETFGRGRVPAWARAVAVLREANDLHDFLPWVFRYAWLFGMRNQAVHFQPEWKSLAMHPSGVKTGPETVDFCLENASTALDIVLDTFTVCLESPATSRQEIKDDWPKKANRTPELKALRAELARETASDESP